MKRLIALLLAVTLCFSLEACSMKTETEPNTVHNQETSQIETEAAETTAATEEPASLNLELVGPWHLDQNKNDLAAFADSPDLFPGYGERGASMAIRGNGQETTDFTVNIRESGVYTIVVEARHAKGIIHIQLAGGNP